VGIVIPCGLKDIKRLQRQVTFACDGDQYTKAILKNLNVETVNYGQLVKERESGRIVGIRPEHSFSVR